MNPIKGPFSAHFQDKGLLRALLIKLERVVKGTLEIGGNPLSLHRGSICFRLQYPPALLAPAPTDKVVFEGIIQLKVTLHLKACCRKGCKIFFKLSKSGQLL